MSLRTNKSGTVSLVIPALVSGIFILVAVVSFLAGTEILDIIFSAFFLILGFIILIYLFREFRYRQSGELIIKHDERSKLNRFKAGDLSFRFQSVLIMLLILFNAFNLLNDTAFVALTGPIVAIGVTFYYLSYFWYERRG
ncbi:MAG: hypothetical protein ACXAC8_16580 [Candidatus Hodarchaeales archaeon]|jgi:hypothetical protein